ncbi:alpha/beta hydrolase [Sphingobacterium bovistauri]|uniref:Esterase family protein n=1 Tax=Sphingobacterium bovistauri TaxID=2781959 RepID=A0ABS7Z3V3_9SPHI|nr:alpha/beta hydrolase family protein [Sphingobacterium bovistauri]MCA5004866.1 esterase family protein [Sphingobacterium bovistauri]
MKNLYLLLLFTFYFSTSVFSSVVDTVEIYSTSMNKKIKAVVIRPDDTKNKTIPTLYLLHGYSGNYSNWIEKVPYIKTLVDQYNYMVVCPDGGFGSWYWDSTPEFQYETFMSKELINYIESNYNVCKHRSGRAITGLSMGGHGALYLAIRHQDIFGALGSTAGGVDIRPFPNNWEMSKRLGEYADNKAKWDDHTVMEMLHLIKPNNLKIFVDCGYDDFFFGVNEELHKKLSYHNIQHTYLNMPGKHDWNYWAQSICFQMAFFDQFFRN